MRKLINLVLKTIVFSSVISTAAVAQTNTKVNINIMHWQTSNQVDVYFVKRDQVPMLDVAVIFAAGSAFDQNNYGVAALTASMIGEGTTKKTAQQIATDFDSTGAQFGADVDQDMATVSLRTLTDKNYLTKSLNSFIDALTSISFPQKAFDRVKQQTFDEIRHNQEDPNNVAMQTFFRSLYGNQPYGHPVIGTIESVKQLSRQDVISFYKKYYVNKNAKIILVGALTKAAAKQLADKISAHIAPGEKASTLQVATQVTKGKKIAVKMPTAQNTIIIGENGIRRQNKDYYNLKVANHILGGPVMTSVFFEKVRNQQGLVYGIYSQFNPLASRGPFYIWLQTRSSKAGSSINLVNQILQNYLQKGPMEAELKAAKLNILGAFPILISTNSAILINTANIAFYNLPLDYLQQYPQKIKAVTRESAKAAFRRQVKPENLNTIVVGNKA